MRCARCRFENPEEMAFCTECGARLRNSCVSCGFENALQAKFCGKCGTPLTGQAKKNRRKGEGRKQGKSGSEPRLQTRSSRPVSYTPKHLAERIRAEQAAMKARGAAEGERKTITALFADIKDSTALIEDLDPEDARHLIDPALQLMMEAVHRYEGYVAQSLGDGIFALFGAPIAHEDHPQRALYAALRMQEESKRYAETLRREKGINLQLRVGVNTGEVVVRSIRKDDLHTDYVPIGHSTNLASRMESLASGGSIVVSEHTHKLTEGYFEFRPLGAAQVKGVSEPINIYEVLSVGPLRTRLQVAVRRGLVQFVGRKSELEQLRKASELARAGHGQIVGVVGEPGVGKSRLFYEFKLLSQSGCLVLETFSVSHGKAYPYLPLIELLNNYFHLTPQDDERHRREKITGRVLTLDRTLEDILPYLFFLLGVAELSSSLQQMDPQIRRRRTFEAIKQVLLRESLNQPLLLIFEDLHWLDNETQAFLSLLGESIATVRLLLLVNYRPEYQHSWGSKTYYTQLRLDPLGTHEAEEMLDALLAEKVGATGRSPLHQFVLTKTEGNPFFMEEMVQALREQGVVVRDGETAPSKPLTELRIPTTVQGVLAARIDHLPAAEKELLQTLAVIGKEFPLGLLQRVVAHADEELQRQLFHLQEVAYNSLLIERRKVLHERTAQAIEVLFHSRLEDHYSELAYHYSRSRNTQKAVEYLQLAGQQAVQRSAYAEAISHLTTALELLRTLPDTSERAQQELSLRITLGVPLIATKGLAAPEVESVYTRARELCRQVGETLQLFPVLQGLWIFYLVGAEFQTARELGEQLLTLAQRVQNPALLLEAHNTLGETLFHLGEFVLAREYLEQGITLYDPQEHCSLTFVSWQDPGVAHQSYAARVLWYLGYPDQALKRSHEALTLAQRLSHPHSLASALYFAAELHQYRRERQATQERAETLIALSSEQGFPVWLANGMILRGWALAKEGQEEEGIAQVSQGLAAFRATGGEIEWPYRLALLAEAYRGAGQAEEGLSVLAEALTVANKTGERNCEAELYRLKGELTLQKFQVSSSKFQVSEGPESEVRGPESEAEECFLKAVEIARKQQAKSVELRAVMSLSRLWQQQGKKAEAHQLLSEIYTWFTEGFDTADLKEAKALLTELEGQEKGRRGKQKVPRRQAAAKATVSRKQ
jgi:class 3 adenylate cyclase/predicted ATPase